MAKKPITIYWGPADDNWNPLYRTPENLYTELLKNKNPKSGRDSFFNCPAAADVLKSTFVFKNALDTKFSYDFSDENNPQIINHNGLEVNLTKPSGIKGGGYVNISMKWLFFAEESVMIKISSPSFHEPTDLIKQGIVPSGRYDISQWFRPYSYEVQMYNEKGMVVLNEGDPMFYLEIITDRPIELKRFITTEKLHDYYAQCLRSREYFGILKPLSERYKVFKAAKMDKIILKEIKANLID